MNSTQRLSNAVDASMPLAQALFDEVRAGTSDEVGVSREPYSAREQVAVDVLTRVAHDLDLENRSDPFGNVYLTLAGTDRAAPAWIAGSHVDSVPRGENFDGFAGVVVGEVAGRAIWSCG